MNKCPNCGKNVSQFASECPHCKRELNNIKSTTITSQTLKYGGKLSNIIITAVVTGIIMAIVIYLHDCMNFRMILPFGDSAYSALIICLNTPNLFVRIILLLLNIIICNVVIHFISIKNGYKPIIRIACSFAFIVIFTTILVILKSGINPKEYQELGMYVRKVIGIMPIFMGLTYGTISYAINQSLISKKYVLSIGFVVGALLLYYFNIYLSVYILKTGINGLFNIVGGLLITMIFAILGSLLVLMRGNK